MLRISVLSRGAVFCALVAVSLLLVFGGCDGPAEPEGGSKSSPLLIEEFAKPEVRYDPLRGTTTVVVQFVARNSRQVPLGEADIDVTLGIDGRPIDVEGLLSQDSETLRTNLHLTLVLDASYSMLQHDSPAFAPMLSSAKRTLGSGSNLYADRPGDFEWDIIWFNDLIYRPLESTASLRWSMGDVERIPSPLQGSFTKLHAAVSEAIDISAAHADEYGSGPRDQHLIVTFSDGADNYSWFGNAEIGGQSTLDPDRQYRYFGAAPISRQQVEQKLQANPEVRMHVMGLGSQVNDAELESLSKAGDGQYFKNLDASKVDTLFDQVIQEFTSVQVHGATVPLRPGQYTFEVVVRAGKSKGTYKFKFQGGDSAAKLLSR